MNNEGKQLIHLLYVPTMYCNLGCQYCYLGDQTELKARQLDWDRALSTLKYAVDKFMNSDVLPFNISLHGGEVTTLPATVMQELFSYISAYYKTHKAVLVENGFKKTNPHIKTNLYNFSNHFSLLDNNEVSISASVDLPLSLHDKYRTTKKGGSTLKRTLDNIKLLSAYPHDKKMSCVLFYEHLDKTDEIIKDIWKLHNEYAIDMNRFNFMFGFESDYNNEKFMGNDSLSTRTIKDEDQVIFYHRMKSEFMGTVLEEGFKTHWFDEFKPAYCTNSFNCGDKFFLLQSDGSVYSCVRGQGVDGFLYGNIFTDSVDQILARASNKILDAHRTQGMHDDCKKCDYLNICQTGCAFVKTELNSSKSYTCALQKEIYKDYPEQYPVATEDEKLSALQVYIIDMHPQLVTEDLMPVSTPQVILPDDLYEEKNTLLDIISNDAMLGALYSDSDIFIEHNGVFIALESQVLKAERKILSISAADSLSIHIKRSLFQVNCRETVRNKLMMQCLRDTPVVYGDEKRTKQQHTFNIEVYYDMLDASSEKGDAFVSYNLKEVLYTMRRAYKAEILNNIFFTTAYLRQYHYEKQKENAFYHIQAINLPFQNIEFYWTF
ncbi:hypothetical protein MNBD_GAMMA11-3423 [hydrothermal vent metagenome]|uniref:4Fe4S-binding SPASM domain-containing protein n=1 Tax=hydrothermal vent metagenome TaxID=652676 RepID=A0A3B0YEB7_9ZZZZ